MELAAYPFEIVNVACIYCTRKGRYWLATLIKRHGASTSLGHLAKLLASECGAALERTGKLGCNGVYLPDPQGLHRWPGANSEGGSKQ